MNLTLAPYHLRLALRGIRRARGLSTAMFVGTVLATSIWTTIFCHYLRFYGPRPALAPSLHQVELPHTSTLDTAFGGSNAEPSAWAARTRVTYAELELLAGSGIPARETSSLRARLLAAPGGDAAGAVPPCVVNARLVSADFFPMFQIPLGAGRAFTRAEDAARGAVTVLGEALARRMFRGAPAVGKTLMIEGRPFQVVGVVDGDQPTRPEWDVAAMGNNQDAIYVPFSWFKALMARPELVLYQSPTGWSFDDLLRSDAVYMVHWADLPTAEARAAYARYLDEHLGPRGIPYKLRSWPEWQLAFPMPSSSILFFTIIGAMVMLASGFNSARLLMAKGMAYRDSFAVHRALGATRGSLFARQVSESLILSLVGGVVGVVLSVPYVWLFNGVVADNDIPVRLTPLAALVGALGAVVTGLVAAIYPAWRLCTTAPSAGAGAGRT
jgi:putative ABC transport system permease protein